jgi:hypothetical protein
MRPLAPAGRYSTRRRLTATPAGIGDRGVVLAVCYRDHAAVTDDPGFLVGSWALSSQQLQAVPHRLVWDNETGIRRRNHLTDGVSAFCGALATRIVQLKSVDPESKGTVERANQFHKISFVPGRHFVSIADFNSQLRDWLPTANARTVRSLRAKPVDLIGADRRRCCLSHRHCRGDSPTGSGCRGTITSRCSATITPSAPTRSDGWSIFTPTWTGKTHLAIGLGVKGGETGHRALFATAIDWFARLRSAHDLWPAFVTVQSLYTLLARYRKQLRRLG